MKLMFYIKNRINETKINNKYSKSGDMGLNFGEKPIKSKFFCIKKNFACFFRR